MLIGTRMWTGPGLPAVATRKARRKRNGISPTVVTTKDPCKCFRKARFGLRPSARVLVLIDGNVGAEKDDRNGAEIGLGNAGGTVGDARAWCFENGRPTGDFCVSFGGVGGGAFVAGQDEFNVRVRTPFFIPADGGFAGRPKTWVTP